MIAVTLSFQEMVNCLKKNSLKLPSVVKMLQCVNNTFSLTVPMKDEADIPLEGVLNFSGQAFNVNVKAGGIFPVARCNVTLGELLHFVLKNIKTFPDSLKEIEYDDKESVFHVCIGMKKDARDIRLMAKLIRFQDEAVRLRVVPVWK